MPTPRRTFTAQDGVSLKEHFDARLEANERAAQLAAHAIEVKVTRICKDIDELRDRMEMSEQRWARLEGKASQNSVIIATVLGFAGLVFGIVDLILKLAGG